MSRGNEQINEQTVMNGKKASIRSRIAHGIAQAIFSRKDTWWSKILKFALRLGVTVFQKKYNFMKDDIIDADIGFDADELDAYQYPNGKPKKP